MKMTLLLELRRKQWSETHTQCTSEHWNKINFTDEERYSLGGPGGNANYWHGKAKNRKRFQNGSVVVARLCFGLVFQ